MQPRIIGRCWVAGRDTPLTRRAIYYTPPNSFTFSLPRLPVHRFVDEQHGAVVYLAWSTRLVEGSPYNAVAVVPITAQAAAAPAR